MTLPFDVLDPKQKIYGNYFLEASAGTGKTFTIAHLVVRLLCESSPAIDISKIGVVTFTKAAAFELKTRIKDLLIEVKSQIEKDLPTFFETSDATKKDLLHLLKLALLDFDFAPISTIHGFCYQLLQKHSAKLGLKPTSQNPEDSSLDALCFDHIKQILQSEQKTSMLSRKQKINLLSSKRGDYGAMISSIKQIVLSGVDIEPLPTWQELQDEIMLKLSVAIPSRENLLEYVNRFKLSPITKEEAASQLERLCQVFERTQDVEELLIKKPFWDYLKKEKLKVKLNEQYSKSAEEFFSYFLTHLAPLIRYLMTPAFAELTLASVCKKSFEDLLVQKGILSFSSMLKNLDTALTQTTSQLISQDFEVMIVDEFQDTDPVQWSILKKLFVQHPVKAFYMVGDPKQAIYAFRSADVYTYMRAKKECPHLQIRTLNTCFRSSAPFIEALNTFLLKTTWLKLPFLNESYPYQRVLAANQDEQSHEPPFHFYKNLSSPEDAEELVTNLTLSLYNTHQNDTIAILVKDRFQLERLEESLKKLGLHFQSIKNEMLDGSIVFSLLDEFLLLLGDPITKGSVNRFMSSSWMNYDLLDFEKTKQERVKPIAFNQTDHLKNHFQEHGFLAALETLLDLTWPEESYPFRQLIVSLYSKDILDKLFEVAHIVQSRCVIPNSAQLLRLELHQIRKDNIKITPLVEQEHKIHILTSHMSKGLEYDHVICLGTSTRYEKTPEVILKRINQQVCLGLVRQDQASYEALYDLDMEKLRQLYVAITRAKKTVHIPQISYHMDGLLHSLLSPLEFFILLIKHQDASYQELYNHVSSLNLDSDILSIFHEPCFLHHTHVDKHTCIESIQTLSVLNKALPLCHIIEDKIVSFSSLKTESDFEKTEDPLKGRDFGDFFHMLMQDLLCSHHYQNFDSQESLNYFGLLCEVSPFKEHKETILQYLKQCLEWPFAANEQDTFCLKDIPPSDLYVEQSFRYHTELGMMKGVIDVALIYDKSLYFIDWKTSFLKDTSPQGMEEHMKKASYDLQLDIYKTALLLQKDYFKNIPLKKAFYMFIKHPCVYEKTLEEATCSLSKI